MGPNVNNERRTTEATVNEPQTNTSKLKKLSVEQLRSELERMKNAKNHFEMLKLGNNATRKEIDKACNTLYKSFHPGNY